MVSNPQRYVSWEAKLEQKINDYVAAVWSATRQEAAAVLLRCQPAWYWQTPEGEYLTKVAGGK